MGRVKGVRLQDTETTEGEQQMRGGDAAGGGGASGSFKAVDSECDSGLLLPYGHLLFHPRDFLTVLL